MFMKFLISVVAISILSYWLGFFLPWWIPAVAAFIVAIILPQRSGVAFLSGFVGVGLYWLVYALMTDVSNEHILSGRMAAIFGLPDSVSFIAVTVLVGSLIGGLSAWGAALVRPAR
jgi:hypothetical protein